jgi:4-diphosphocytidyl-2-C-methyl-D-erythritol kinase
MKFTAICSIKINLTLRVLDKRDDGYHDIRSLFWRLESPESLDVTLGVGRDELVVTGDRIAGENIVASARSYIRRTWGERSLPPARIELHKHIPRGSGVGAGSGNAAALLRLFAPGVPPDVCSIGADVAFLASGLPLALASGTGGCLEDVGGDLDLGARIFFPEWNNDTRSMYGLLDGDEARRRVADPEAREEAFHVLGALRRGERLGMLPNDFAVYAGHEEEYGALAAAVESDGALAWGLCGSGSAFFALRGRGSSGAFPFEKYGAFQWLRQILVLE